MRKTILIVDDERDTVASLTNFLAGQGFRTLAAYDGEEGLRVALEEKPELILLDIVMPKKDGFAMLAGLKGDDTTKKIPVILLSAKSETSYLFEGQRRGAIDYLIKPINIDDLMKYVQKYLNIYESS